MALTTMNSKRPITTLFMLTSVGGKETATVIDGNALTTPEELKDLGVLKLQECQVLDHSYLRLRYKVIS